jgi:hypothetical protein
VKSARINDLPSGGQQSFEAFLKSKGATPVEVKMDENPTERSITFYMNEEDESFDRVSSEEKCGKMRPNREVLKAATKFSRDELV